MKGLLTKGITGYIIRPILFLTQIRQSGDCLAKETSHPLLSKYFLWCHLHEIVAVNAHWCLCALKMPRIGFCNNLGHCPLLPVQWTGMPQKHASSKCCTTHSCVHTTTQVRMVILSASGKCVTMDNKVCYRYCSKKRFQHNLSTMSVKLCKSIHRKHTHTLYRLH